MMTLLLMMSVSVMLLIVLVLVVAESKKPKYIWLKPQWLVWLFMYQESTSRTSTHLVLTKYVSLSTPRTACSVPNAGISVNSKRHLNQIYANNGIPQIVS